MKNAFDGLTVDWTWLRKESLSLRICPQKLPNLKGKENIDWKKKKKKKNGISQNCERITMDTHVMGNPER